MDPLRHHRSHSHLHRPFGNDRFGAYAERFARFFGTAYFLIIQSFFIVVWIACNVVGFIKHWDPYPFILLNLFFSTQAAYSAPLILLAQTRQADRDKAHEEAEAKHREDVAEEQRFLLHTHRELLEANTELTREIHEALKHS